MFSHYCCLLYNLYGDLYLESPLRVMSVTVPYSLLTEFTDFL